MANVTLTVADLPRELRSAVREARLENADGDSGVSFTDLDLYWRDLPERERSSMRGAVRQLIGLLVKASGTSPLPVPTDLVLSSKEMSPLISDVRPSTLDKFELSDGDAGFSFADALASGDEAFIGTMYLESFDRAVAGGALTDTKAQRDQRISYLVGQGRFDRVDSIAAAAGTEGWAAAAQAGLRYIHDGNLEWVTHAVKKANVSESWRDLGLALLRLEANISINIYQTGAQVENRDAARLSVAIETTLGSLSQVYPGLRDDLQTAMVRTRIFKNDFNAHDLALFADYRASHPDAEWLDEAVVIQRETMQAHRGAKRKGGMVIPVALPLRGATDYAAIDRHTYDLITQMREKIAKLTPSERRRMAALLKEEVTLEAVVYDTDKVDDTYAMYADGLVYHWETDTPSSSERGRVWNRQWFNAKTLEDDLAAYIRAQMFGFKAWIDKDMEEGKIEVHTVHLRLTLPNVSM